MSIMGPYQDDTHKSRSVKELEKQTFVFPVRTSKNSILRAEVWGLLNLTVLCTAHAF